MKLELSAYATLVFDCDGVILDSNKIKTEAFRTAALPWGVAAAQALVSHHIENGGVSRYEKFQYFIEQILPRYVPNYVSEIFCADLQVLLDRYSQSTRSGLMGCAIAEGLDELRSKTLQARWLVVSGGDQLELQSVFEARGIARYFDGGIFGSPDSKATILAREIAAKNIRFPAVLFGDSRLDQEASVGEGLEFVFVAGWSEWVDGQTRSCQGDFASVQTLSELLRR